MNMRSWKTYSKPGRKVRAPVLTSVPDAPVVVVSVKPPKHAEILIEKGVPIPESQRRYRGSSTYPFADMAVGDSFLLPSAEKSVRNRVYMAALYWGKPRGQKFATRVVEGGLRIWRLV